MRKILINGAGRGCLNLVKTAKEMGLYVVVTGMAGPCIPLADKSYPEVHPGHPEEVLEVARKEKVDGIAISCNDNGLTSVGYCCDILGLNGISYEAAQLCTNKLEMKKKLSANGVRTAPFHLVHDSGELSSAAEELGFPLIVKATDLQGSRGICIVKEQGVLQMALDEVMSLSSRDYCILEEFIDGVEFGAQAFVSNGEVLFVLPHGDETFMAKTAVPIGHYMPYEMSEELAFDVENQARGAIEALGLDNCAVNIDFISRGDQAFVIELTGRGGANGLTDITGKYFGINYYEMIITAALGEDPMQVFSHRLTSPKATVSKMIKWDRSGEVNSIIIPELLDTEINIFFSPGDDVRRFTNSNDAIGEIIVSGDSLCECESLLEKAVKSIDISIK